MRKVRYIAAILVSAILFVFLLSGFLPCFSENVEASEDIIYVSSYMDLFLATGNSSNINKTIRFNNDIKCENNLNISFPMTLDLCCHQLSFITDTYLNIRMQNDTDIFTITGTGHISGNCNCDLISLVKGYLCFESGYIFNQNRGGGYLTNSSNVTVYNCELGMGRSFGDKIVIPGEKYYPDYTTCDLLICGRPISRYDNTFGDGVFTYDPSSKTLTISGDYDYCTNGILIESRIEDLIIKVDQTSNLVGIFLLLNDTTITGNNKLTLTSDSTTDFMICSDGFDLTLKNISLEMNGHVGFVGFGGCLLIEDSELIVNCDYFIISEVTQYTEIVLKDCELVEPVDAVLKDGIIYKSDGTTLASCVKIIPVYYLPAEYSWSSDLTKCTATRVHKYDKTLTETETVEAKITTDEETITYTASFKNKAFTTQTKTIPNVSSPSFEDFVERLYVVALDRPSEPEGKAFWSEHVNNGDLNGAQCANEFLLSKEFNDRKLSDEDFLKVLYKTFFDRNVEDDKDGFDFWMNSLKTQGRDVVVDCFINSTEWCNVCATYGVKSGATRAKATIASKNATAFATRLYTECLGRDPEEGGLKFWSLGLTNLELTGSAVAHEFFFCKEFNDHNFDNKELITRMYRTFMGREPDDAGMTFWLDSMSKGATKQQVFDDFVKSPEFTQICKDYAIERG